jgi:DNA-binding transcriptional MerR regulator
LDQHEVKDGAQATDAKLLRVGQLADLCGKTVRALHLYEELGLLRPVHRSKGGFRLYAESAVNRVQWISRLQDADLSLSEIKEFLHDLEQEQVATSAMTRARSMFEQKLLAIRQQRAKLEKLEADLVAGLSYLDACKTCEPEHLTSECDGCRLHGHDGSQPLLVAGIHVSS